LITSGLSGLPAQPAQVCVVGAGPAGITLALELAAKGLRVLVLESGGEAEDKSLAELSASEIVDPKVHDDTRITMSRRLGGTSNLWGARCQPLDPIDLADRPWIGGASWPMALSDIEPWYARACELLGCGEPAFRSDEWASRLADKRVDVARLERFSNRPKMQVAHRHALQSNPLIDIRLQCTVVDAGLGQDGRLEHLWCCTPDGARHKMPVQCVVLAMGGLETTRFMLALQQQHPMLFGGPYGALGRFYMAHVVGEVSDVTFQSDEVDRAFDFILDDHGSYARRRFIPSDDEQRRRELTNVSFWPVVPPVADARHGSALLSAVFLAMSIGPVGRLLMAEAIRRYHAPEGVARGPHLTNVLRDLPSAVAGSTRFLFQRYVSRWRIPGFFIHNPNRTYGLSYHAEHLPSADSRVTLSSERDRFGLPRLRVDLRFDLRDAQALYRAHELMREWLAATGIGTLRYRQPAEETPEAILAVAKHGTHQIGTIRMGADRRDGIVDRNLRSFDVGNLYVASSAVFPSSGQANPTLTIMALAARLAAHLSTKQSPMPQAQI
jgi:choline dehydrogenase-like flavoprotein